VFSHRFVKTFPGASRGFEIETELAVHALQMRLPIAEIETVYGRRIDGSMSKGIPRSSNRSFGNRIERSSIVELCGKSYGAIWAWLQGFLLFRPTTATKGSSSSRASREGSRRRRK
jgi:hypothetical protein